MKKRTSYQGQSGLAAIWVAIVLTVLLGVAALAVDLGYLFSTRNELQNIADAAALAGTRRLGEIYEVMPTNLQASYSLTSGDAADIRTIVKNVSAQNKAAGKSITIQDADIIVGQWKFATKTLDTSTLLNPDAVRVIARREAGAAEGPISTFFARIFNQSSLDVSATATAALSGETTAPQDGLPFPAGIPRYRFENKEFCQQDIKFYPTGTLDGCAGWHVYTETKHGTSTQSKILKGLKDGTYHSPATTAYETVYNFKGGTVATLFDELRALFDYKRTRDDDGNDATWTTSVVVYDGNDCSNPNQDILIVGFATVIIREVTGPPGEKRIVAKIVCDRVEPGRGGGGNYGTKGSIPGLVQ